jgi:hypothetical protein
MGFKQMIRADLKRLPAVRYVLGIFNVKPLSLLQIYSRKQHLSLEIWKL